MSDNKEIILFLELTPNEANIIIEGLGTLPFKDVYKIIEKIHLSANSVVTVEEKIRRNNIRLVQY